MLYEERKHTALLNCVTTWLYKSTVLMKHRVYWYWNCFGCKSSGWMRHLFSPLVPSCNHFGLFQMLFLLTWVSTTLHSKASTSHHFHLGLCPGMDIWVGIVVWKLSCSVTLLAEGWAVQLPPDLGTVSCAFLFAVTGASRQHQCCRKPDYLLWFILREC